jgi:dihydrofolate reductase
MGKIVCNISMSLDGYIAGPDDDNDKYPLGKGGERIHEWVYELKSWRSLHGLEGGIDSKDGEIIAEIVESTGAMIMGRRMFDSGEKYWGDNPPFRNPLFIVTHTVPEITSKGGKNIYNFVTGGIESALGKSKAAAGDKDIAIMGGADIIQQFIKAKLLDEIQIHLIPVLFCGGKKLFDNLGDKQIGLEIIRVVNSPNVTHIKYKIVK